MISLPMKNNRINLLMSLSSPFLFVYFAMYLSFFFRSIILYHRMKQWSWNVEPCKPNGLIIAIRLLGLSVTDTFHCFSSLYAHCDQLQLSNNYGGYYGKYQTCYSQ